MIEDLKGRGSMKELTCPHGHEKMEIRLIEKTIPFRGLEILCQVEVYVCPECGLEAGTVQSTGAVQQKLAESFRKRYKPNSCLQYGGKEKNAEILNGGLWNR